MADSAIGRSIASANLQIDIPQFDPVAWLARYIELGGGYSVHGDRVWLGWPLECDSRDKALREHGRQLDPSMRAAVKALIMDRSGQMGAVQ